MLLRLGTASLLLALLLAPARAAADVSDADRATARALAVDGQEALERRDFAAAFDRFRRADAIIHAPTLALGVARAQVGLGQWIAAQESYTRIVREGAPAGSPEPFFAAVEDARRELDALSPRIPQILVQVDGADAPDVTIDGAVVPRAALGVRRPVDPGTRVVRATAPGREPVEAKVTLAEGANQTVTLRLKPEAAPAPAEPAPIAPIAPKPDEPAPSGSGRTALTVAAFGVGGVGLAIGAVAGLVAVGKHGDLETSCKRGTCDPSQQGDVDSYHAMGTLSTIGFIAGGVGVAAGAVLLLTAPSAPKQAAFIAPVIGVGYAGARGRF